MKTTLLVTAMVMSLCAGAGARASGEGPLTAVSEYDGQRALMQTRQAIYAEIARNVRDSMALPVIAGQLADNSERETAAPSRGGLFVRN